MPEDSRALEGSGSEPELESLLGAKQAELIKSQLLYGWAALSLVVIFGAVLEVLHAYKVPAYVHPEHETRRLLLRLAHAHAGLLALIQLALAWSLSRLPLACFEKGSAAPWVARGATLALFLLPAGFLLGGLSATGGDPGIGILLVPLGAFVLLASLLTLLRLLLSA